MGKWLWLYPLEQQSLWASVIQFKFGNVYIWWDAAHLHFSSHRSLWKGISQILPFFLPFTSLSLGLERKPYSGLILGSMPSLFSFSSSFKPLFSEVFNHFVFPFYVFQLEPPRRDLRDCLISDLSSLLNLIHNVHLSPPTLILDRGPSLLQSSSLSLPFSLLFRTPVLLSPFPIRQSGSPPSLPKNKPYFEKLLVITPPIWTLCNLALLQLSFFWTCAFFVLLL